mmetsp:Transcript_52906/g.72458  ORF Transcript_52906/g.72458 Transcript_52906/m.72458 type:complete len:102 (+) Transcript_52906:1643-1948(+)
MIYDMQSIILRHQIQANHVIKSFYFANNNRDIVIITKDTKIKFYRLNCFEGEFKKEITTVHRGDVTALDISKNGDYFLSGGEDNLIKVWDYEANKTIPFYY